MIERYSWTQPQCRPCWNEANPEKQVSVFGEPERGPLELCVTCGHSTRSGIYIRIDPSEAPHPTLTK